MSAELKPCPFCGAKAELYQNIKEDGTGDYNGRYFVRCDPCDLVIDSAWDVPEAEAIAAWNRRATPSQRLDAATVECTASYCEGYGPWKVLALHGDSAWIVHHDERGMATYRSVDQADLITAEPHQHGAGNGEKHGG